MPLPVTFPFVGRSIDFQATRCFSQFLWRSTSMSQSSAALKDYWAGRLFLMYFLPASAQRGFRHCEKPVRNIQRRAIGKI